MINKYLLDTCIISEIIKTEPNQNVINWLLRHNNTYLSSLTIGEIIRGIAKLPKGKYKQKLNTWYKDNLLPNYGDKIINIDVNIAKVWGELQAKNEIIGNKRPIIDSLIVATAIAYDYIIVTRNTKDMENEFVEIVNPFK